MNNRFIKAILLSIGLLLAVLTHAQTHLGSWIVATDYSYYDPNVTCTSEFYELQFTTAGINTVLLGNASGITGFNNKLDIATGSGYYSTDNSPACYVLVNNDRISYYNSNNLLSHNTFWDNMNHTTMVIPKPGSSTKYCAIYAASGIAKGSQGDMWISVISNPGGQLGVDESHSFAFYKPDHTDWCMTSELAGDRHIYFTTNPDGLCRVSVNEVLADNETLETLVAPDTYGLAGHFDAHEIELKQHANTVDIAWTTLESSGDLYRIIYNFTTNSSQAQVHHLNQGVIAGIEYDQFENDIIYVSCEAGIVKYNFDTETSTTLASSGNYKHTCLQTAPDGYIYGVRDQGGYLGRIDQQTATFTPEAYHFNYTGSGSDPDGYLTNKRIVDNQVYFLLPKHDVLSSLADPVAVSCPGMSDGQVTIYAGGGTPDYTLSCFLGTTEITGFYYNNTDYTFYHDALSEGFYTYTLYDARGMQAKGSFEIEAADDYYDFKDTKFEVSASRSLPDANMPLNTYSFEAGIHIRSGATLTITGSVYEFGKWAKVIVEPGATLELVGTTLTNHEECHLIWQGVEVQGDATMPQQPELINGVWVYHQGRLVMQNATISNAYQAVGLLTRNSNGDIEVNSGGGIVVANNSYFINNVNSVQFIPYKNFNPGSIAQIDNVSYFSDCNFVIDQSYLGDETFSNHVNMYGVKGIDFRGCDFSNTALHDISTTNTGIVAYGAGFTVTSLCSQHVDPCPVGSVVPSTFTGFYNAISVYGDNSYIYSYLVENSLFSNNKIGILNSKVNYPVIINNEFFIGHDHPELTYGGYVGLGVDCQQSTGFAIENNEFHKNGAAPLGSYIGIRINETKTGFDEVYKNTFDGLAGGNLSEGRNWQISPDWRWIGLAYYCNENDNNWADFYVSSDLPSGIQARQGDDDHAAGNTFSPSATWHFYNGGRDEIGYYYNQNVSDQIPDDKKLYHVTDEARSNVNTCPEHYTGGGSVLLTSVQKTDKETDFLNNLYDYNSVEAQYEALVDGGSTSSELSDIQTATPDEMWELRTKLLGDSPHLSLEVLMEASDRTDVFPDDVLFDILASNPDELKRDTLISYLENKENPLPDYMIAILLQVAQGTTYKTVLQNQMSLYNQYKTKAASDMVRSLLNDTIADLTELRNWLDNTSTLKADEQIIATYMHEGNYSDALAMAALLPDTYNLSSEELSEHTNYVTLLNLQVAMAQANRNIFQLDSTEFNTVLSLADNSKGTGGVLARNMLTYAFGYNFYTFPELNDTASYKIQPAGWNNFIEWSGVEISAKPNPAKAWTAFDYVLPDADSKGSILITDVSGRLIQTIPVSGLQGQEVWDTRNVKAGVYFFTLNAGGISKTGKIVVCK